MKILIDARFYGLEHAGLGRYTINLINKLSEIDRRNRYLILLRKKYFYSLKVTDNFQKILADFKHYSISEQIGIPSIINKYKPDLVHFLNFNIPIFWKGKFIVTIHDMTMHKQGRDASLLPLYIYYLKRLFYKFTFKKAVKDAVKIIVPSNYVKNDLTNYFNIEPEKIEVIYEGFDNKYQITTNNKSVIKGYNIIKEYFIYTGNLYPHKNIKRAIKGLLLINKNLKEKVLLIIVSSKDIFQQKIENMVKELKVEDEVIYLHNVSDEDLANLYRNSIAFIYPSLAEGFGLQGIEAMASGTLLIASDIPVFREIYQNNAIYFNPNSVESIEDSMKNIMKMEKGEKEKRINEAKEFVKKYSWTKMATETLEIYEEH